MTGKFVPIACRNIAWGAISPVNSAVAKGRPGEGDVVRTMLKASLIATMIAVFSGECFAGAIEADGRDRVCRPQSMVARSTVVTRWNERALEAICIGRPMPTIVSRELFLLHAAIYDAWALIDPVARPIYASPELGQTFDRPWGKAKAEAISYAALEVLTELYPAQIPNFFDELNREGFGFEQFLEPEPGTAAWIGIAAANAVLDARDHDGANAAQHYADVSGYQPVNPPDAPRDQIDPNRWQPLVVTDFNPSLRPADFVLNPPFFDPGEYGQFAPQMFITPHWPQVAPFALQSADQLRPPPPPRYGDHSTYVDAMGRETTSHQAYVDQFTEVVEIQASLTEEQRVIAQVWSHDGPYFATPAGHWNHFAQQISRRDKHTVDDDAKLFMALNGALLDAGIVAWDSKVAYDSVRPITAIRMLFAGQTVFGWLGRDQGFGSVRGEDWIPYQWTANLSPAFAEYVSGHSAFAAAAALVLQRFTGSDRFHDPSVKVGDMNRDHVREAVGVYVVKRGQGAFERATPQDTVTLRWDTFSQAAEQCGMARLFAGVHIMDANLRGQEMGRAAADQAYQKAEKLWSGN